MTAGRKSMSKIRQILGTEAPDLYGTQESIPQLPPRKSSVQLSRRRAQQQHRQHQGQGSYGRRSIDASQTLDIKAFPVRRDDEFRSNGDFNLDDDDDDGMELDAKAQGSMPSQYQSRGASISGGRPLIKGMRTPGVIRQSFDSIFSPFRANSNANQPSKSSSPEQLPPARQSMEAARNGRRSFSESRLVRPFLRQRSTVRGGRPLSKVADWPETVTYNGKAREPSRNDTSDLETQTMGSANTRYARSKGRPIACVQRAQFSQHQYPSADEFEPADSGQPWLNAPFANMDNRSSTIVEAGHGAFPDERRCAMAQVPSEQHQSLLPAAELVGSSRSTASPAPTQDSLPWKEREAHRAALIEQQKMQTAAMLEMVSPAFARLTPDEKMNLLARNTYFIPPKDSGSRPGLGHQPSNAHGTAIPTSDTQHVGAYHASLPSMSSSPSLTSSYSKSTNNNVHGMVSSKRNESVDSFSRQPATTPTSQSRRKFAGLLNRVKGTFTPGNTPPNGPPSFDSPASSVMTPSQSWDADVSGNHTSSHGGTPRMGPYNTESPVGLGFLNGPPLPEKDEKPLTRLRIKSFASKKVKRKSPKPGTTPEEPMPRVKQGDNISTKDEAWRRNLLSEAVGMSLGGRSVPSPLPSPNPGSSPPAVDEGRPDLATLEAIEPRTQAVRSPESGSRPFGKLLRKKKTHENLDEVIQSFVALPPKMLHPDVVQEAAPRPSMSSARGFVITGPEEEMLANGMTPQTIRKTLSPALLSDSVNVHRTSVVVEEGSDEEQSLAMPDTQDSCLSTSASHEKTAGAPAFKVDETEELAESDGDLDTVQSPMRRFIRRNASIDRLSRVEEMSERQSLTVDSQDSYGMRKSTSSPGTPNRRSFSEHRQIRKRVSGNFNHASPPSLDIGTAQEYRYGKRSMDVPRSSGTFDDARSLPYESPVVTSRKMSFGDTLFPRPFATPRNGRTSFSQDRDRAPVASPLSPMREKTSRSPALVQAMKKLRGKSSKDWSRGIGPKSVPVSDYGELEESDYGRPSMSMGRPSMDPDAVAEMTKLLEVHRDAMAPSPITPSFQSRNASSTGLAITFSETELSENVGLGLGPIGTPITRSLTSRSVSSSLNGYSTPPSQPPESVYTPRTPEIMAFVDMLDKFGEKERQLLKGISARAAAEDTSSCDSFKKETA